MLTEICQYLKNWFNRKPDGSDYPKYFGDFTIENGEIIMPDFVEGQYFRIMGSLFNDGVHVFGSDVLRDETFNGAVWVMSVPPAVIQLAAEISDWQAKYGGADSNAMSPFVSESFGGYSYSKSSAGVSGSSSGGTAWQDVYAKRLSPWRKI